MSHQPVVLFDFDGVIITQKSLEYTASIFLKKSFYDWKNTDNLRFIDLARMFEEADSKNKIKALLRIINVYKPYIPSLWKRIMFFLKFRRTFPKYENYETLKPNLESVLTKLKKKGFVLGIVSNTSGSRLDRFRKKLELDKYFSIYISRDDSPYRKPNPFPIYVALKEIKNSLNISINKELVYYIGDLPPDIQCAKNAEVNSIALLSGHGTQESLENSNPSFIIKDIKNILEIEPIKKFLLD
ncbi:MAG: HAD family hydrolase [Promethearchaeota archaeon]|jgi:HAD superfamily hydrolase (TIGR01549 family)